MPAFEKTDYDSAKFLIAAYFMGSAITYGEAELHGGHEVKAFDRAEAFLEEAKKRGVLD